MEIRPSDPVLGRLSRLRHFGLIRQVRITTRKAPPALPETVFNGHARFNRLYNLEKFSVLFNIDGGLLESEEMSMSKTDDF
jgi:hypothetical protein